MPKEAPLYDFAVMDNSEHPRSMVYNIDNGKEVATFDTSMHGQLQAERVCDLLNEMEAERLA